MAKLKDTEQIYTPSAALESVGANLGNAFQIRACLLLNCAWNAGSIIMGALPFFQRPPIFLCDDVECDAETACLLERDRITIHSSGYVTWTTEFELVCESAYLVGSFGTALMLGAFVGSYITGRMSDTHGRKLCLQYSIYLQLASLAVIYWTTNFRLLILAVFVFGIARNACNMLTFVLFGEIINEKASHWNGTLFNSMMGIAVATAALLAKIIPDWRTFIIVAAGQALIVVINFPSIPESPKYLIMRHKYDEARSALSLIAKGNGKEEFTGRFESEGIQSKHSDDKAVQSSQIAVSYSTMDIFKYRSVRIPMIASMILWFATGMCFFGIYLMIPQLSREPDDIYLIGVLLGAVEFVSALVSGAMAGRLGRKISTQICLLISVISFGLAPYTTDFSAVALTISAAKFGVSAAFNMAFIYSSEIFPTVIRTTACGLCSLIARVGQLIAPSFIIYCEQVEVSPSYFFCFVCFLALIAVQVLPETQGQKTPDSIVEVDEGTSKKEVELE